MGVAAAVNLALQSHIARMMSRVRCSTCGANVCPTSASLAESRVVENIVRTTELATLTVTQYLEHPGYRASGGGCFHVETDS